MSSALMVVFIFFETSIIVTAPVMEGAGEGSDVDGVKDGSNVGANVIYSAQNNINVHYEEINKDLLSISILKPSFSKNCNASNAAAVKSSIASSASTVNPTTASTLFETT